MQPRGAKNLINRIRPAVMTVAALVALLCPTAHLAAQQLPGGRPPAAQRPQTLNSIEVLVNDEPLSTFDINERLRLILALSGGVSSQEELLKVREQVIRTMVNERLQLQEANERGVNVPPGQLEEFFVRRAQGFGQQPDQLEQALAQIGSSKRSMVNQLHAEYAWNQLVNGLLGRFAEPSDDEVQDELQRLRDNKGKFEYRLQEIVLLVSDPSREQDVKSNADALLNQINGGASFTELATQLSASSSAAVGGDMGWATADNIAPDYVAAVENADLGEVIGPVRTAGGYSLINNLDRRRIMVADPLDTQFQLTTLHLTPEMLTDEARVANFMTVTDRLRETGAKCEDIEALVKEANTNEQFRVGAIRLRDVNQDLRNALRPLQAGQVTPVLDLEGDGMRVMIVCERVEPVANEPEYDDILDQLQQQRLAMMNRRFLRDLRRDAIIDYR